MTTFKPPARHDDQERIGSDTAHDHRIDLLKSHISAYRGLGR